MYPFRGLFERLHRLRPRVMLEKSDQREVEQRRRWAESFRGARAEDLSRLVQDEDGDQLSLEANAARRKPAHLVEAAQAEQTREFIDAVTELNELPARHYPHALAIRQMVDRRLQRRDVDAPVARDESLAQHAPPVVVPNERDLREAVDFRERFAE